MATDYKITEFDPDNGQIIVHFLPLDVSVAVDLPLDKDGNAPTGVALEAYIKGFLPYGILERKKLLANGIKNAAAIAALVESA